MIAHLIGHKLIAIVVMIITGFSS